MLFELFLSFVFGFNNEETKLANKNYFERQKAEISLKQEGYAGWIKSKTMLSSADPEVRHRAWRIVLDYEARATNREKYPSIMALSNTVEVHAYEYMYNSIPKKGNDLIVHYIEKTNGSFYHGTNHIHVSKETQSEATKLFVKDLLYYNVPASIINSLLDGMETKEEEWQQTEEVYKMMYKIRIKFGNNK